jgi:hypothetical protein
MKAWLARLAGTAALAVLCACASESDAEPGPQAGEPQQPAEPAMPMPDAEPPDPIDAGDTTQLDAASGGAQPDSGPAAGFDEEGQCYFEGSGVYQDGVYTGTIAFVLYAEPFSDEELCRIQLDLDTVADADPECDFCYFSTVVQMSNPVEIVNVDNQCANSERALDSDAIDALLAAPPVAMGFAEEASGHGEVLVEYDAALMRWAEVAFGSFDPATGVLLYDQNEGFCRH